MLRALVVTLVIIILALRTFPAHARDVFGFEDETGFTIRLGDKVPPEGAVLVGLAAPWTEGNNHNTSKYYSCTRTIRLAGKDMPGSIVNVTINGGIILTVEVLIPPKDWTLHECVAYYFELYSANQPTLSEDVNRLVYTIEDEPLQSNDPDVDDFATFTISTIPDEGGDWIVLECSSWAWGN